MNAPEAQLGQGSAEDARGDVEECGSVDCFQRQQRKGQVKAARPMPRQIFSTPKQAAASVFFSVDADANNVDEAPPGSCRCHCDQT
ncbi:hypothetical protein HC762_00055 [bacterium]|nr:hypothetical protein [bacterium]